MLSQNRQKPVYSFPELRSAEILQCLEDLRIPVGEADLVKPSGTVVQRIYEAFADIFMGAVREPVSAQLSKLAVSEMLEYPEIHNDSVGLITFYRTL